MVRYNLEVLNDQIDAVYIAQMLGIESEWHGNRLYIRCPEHEDNVGKAENKIDNCLLSNRGYHCFSCGASGSVYKLIQLTQGVSMPEAIRIAAELSGVEAESVIEGENQSYFPLSNDELALIGLQPSVLCKCTLNECRDKQEIVSREYTIDGQYANLRYFPETKTIENSYTVAKNVRSSLLELWNSEDKEDQELCLMMIRGKIEEQLFDISSVIEDEILEEIFDKRTAYLITEELKKNMIKLNYLAQKFGASQLPIPASRKRISRFKIVKSTPA